MMWNRLWFEQNTRGHIGKVNSFSKIHEKTLRLVQSKINNQVFHMLFYPQYQNFKILCCKLVSLLSRLLEAYTQKIHLSLLGSLCYSLFSESFRYVVNSHLLDFLVFRSCCLVLQQKLLFSCNCEHTGKKKKKVIIFSLYCSLR